LEPRVRENCCRVDLQLSPTTITGDPVLLRAIMSNLLENACDHSPRGSSVLVRASEEQGRFCWRVTNPAPDLSREDLPRLGERFWRKDSARMSSTHTGLGLSI